MAQHEAAEVAQPRGDRAAAGVGFVALLAALSALACGKDAARADAGQDPDAGAPCAGGALCDGTSVRACRMGRTAEVIEECAPDGACSMGRCVTTACARAEDDHATFTGCTFYTFYLDNVTSDDTIPTSVLVTNPGQTPATVALERRDATASSAAALWTTAQSQIVPPMRAARLRLADDHVEGGGLAPRGAYRLTSDLPVTAAHVQSDDSTAGGSRSTGGTLLLPAHVLGSRYRALTYGQAATPELQDTPGARGGAGQVVIVGTADGTHVTIAPSATADLGPGGGVPPPGPDGDLHLTLDDGDLFTLYSNRDGADLSGTEVSSDRPIAVFSGNISTTYGITATGVSSPDLAHEQLLPVNAWGTAYVAAQLEPQAGVCDPLLPFAGAAPASGPAGGRPPSAPTNASIWTIVADRDGTQVRFSSASGAVVAPDRTLGAGEAFHISVPGSFVVSGNFPIEVMQGIDCEPSLSSAVPTSTLLTELYFAVLPNFATEAAIVRAVGDPLYIDGVRVPMDATVEPAGGGFEVLHLPIDACAPADDVCTHHLEGKFGLTLRGMDVLASWALTAPTWCVDSPTTNCIR
ncbi:MAG TPA: IgGFc-binding protein [Polyangia bacterium]|nr:IgGFc-binding protein [Polyangia bacterium]